jgi:hypothetical protein
VSRKRARGGELRCIVSPSSLSSSSSSSSSCVYGQLQSQSQHQRYTSQSTIIYVQHMHIQCIFFVLFAFFLNVQYITIYIYNMISTLWQGKASTAECIYASFFFFLIFITTIYKYIYVYIKWNDTYLISLFIDCLFYSIRFILIIDCH